MRKVVRGRQQRRCEAKAGGRCAERCAGRVAVRAGEAAKRCGVMRVQV